MIREPAGYLLFDTAIGHCGLAWGGRGLTRILLPEGSKVATRLRMKAFHPTLAEGEGHAPSVAREAVDRIRGLLHGEKDALLDLTLDMSDVPLFNRRVYALVRSVGPGLTTTYGEVALRLREPSAARAVGQALARNPFAPVVPCHRVLAAAGRSGGFSAGGGLVTKLRMLQVEGAKLSRERGLFD